MQNKKNFKELCGFFERVAHLPVHQAMNQSILDFLKPVDQEIGLEFGAGPGSLSRAIVDQAHTIVHSTDSEMDMLAAGANAFAHHQIVRMKMDAQTWFPRPQERFDFIVGALVLHLLDHPKSTLRQASLYLKPGGRIVIMTPSDKISKELASTWCESEALQGEAKEFVHGMTNSALNHHQFSARQLQDFGDELGLQVRTHYTGFQGSQLLAEFRREKTVS